MRHQFRLALVPGRPAVSLPQHEAIVTAIAAGDPQAAERAMHEHIDSVIEALRGLVPRRPDGEPTRPQEVDSARSAAGTSPTWARWSC